MEVLKINRNIEILKVLADGTRLKIILLLSKQEMAVCELIAALNLSQPAVSHHLKLLKQAGLIQDNREGKWILYTINKENFNICTQDLKTFFEEVQNNLGQGVTPSLIRTEPCLCDALKTKGVKTSISDPC